MNYKNLFYHRFVAMRTTFPSTWWKVLGGFLMCVVAILFSFCFIWGSVFAEEGPGFATQLGNVYSSLSTTSSKKDFVSNYCSATLDRVLVFSGENARWDFENSLFVLALCTSRWGEEVDGVDLLFQDKFREDWERKEKSWFDSFTEEAWDFIAFRKKDPCKVGEQTNNCDVAHLAWNIFTVLMNEVFVIKWASSLDVLDPKNFPDEDTRFKDFFKTYFSVPIDSKLYGVSELYEDTEEMLTDNQEEMKERLEKVEKLKVPQETQNANYPLPNWIGTWAGKMDQDFVSFITNEYLAYSVFVDVYTQWLAAQAMQSSQGANNSLSDSDKDFYALELSVMKQQRQELKQALQTALREWQEFSASYPVHVGLAWYQEALLRLRDDASKLLSPFYALYEKLRNAQAAN